jgi:hypothetical protein
LSQKIAILQHFAKIIYFQLHFGKIPKKFGQNLARFSKNSAKFWQIWKKSAHITAIFNEKIEIPKRCKGVHCVDLGESFPTSIYLQNLASIQPRTSLFNFFNFSPALVI